MYPYQLFAGLDLYSLLLALGVFCAMLLIRVQGDWRGYSAKLQNLLIWNTVAAVILGYGSSVLFQAFYNYMDDGVFEIVRNTGATFYGGLIGGAAMFIILYFVAGHFLIPNGEHKARFRETSDLAAACIAGAHGFGRLGCLMAGCCHGARTDAWYGVMMHIPGDNFDGKVKVIPVQLYEAVFLLALCALLLLLFKQKRRYQMPIYMITYAVWRFIAEMLRADDRGATVVDFLSPSQLISVLLLAGGLVLLGIELYLDERNAKRAAAEGIAPETDATEPVDTSDPSETDVTEAETAEVETAPAPTDAEGADA